MEQPIENKNTRPTRFFIVTLLVLMVILFFVSKDMEKVQDYIRGSGIIGVFICIALYALLGASVIPSEPLTVLIATIFGPLIAMLVAGLGNTAAAMVEYYLGQKIGDIASFSDKKSKLPLGLGKMPIDSPLFLMLGRMMPGYGPKLVSLMGGMYRVPIWRYVWTTAIPTFIGAGIFAYGGFGIFSWVKQFIH